MGGRAMTGSTTPTKPAPIAPFDYECMPPATVTALKEQASRIRNMVKTTMSTIIQIGNDLIAVKQTLEHGKFCAWIESECGFSIRTAENYIRSAEFAEGKSATVALLQPATVYRLAAKNAPAVIVDAVIQRALSGQIISDREVSAAFEQVRAQKRQADRNRRPPAPTRGQIARQEKIRRKIEDHNTRRTAMARAAAQLILDDLGREKAERLLSHYFSNEHDFYEVLIELKRIATSGSA
jgi:hypothetical protein